MHQGVIKDMARQEQHVKNLMDQNRQIMVEEQYRQALAEKEKSTKTE